MEAHSADCMTWPGSTLCQATSHKQQVGTTRQAYIAVKQADRPAKTDGSLRSLGPSLLLTLAALHILGAHAGQQFLIQRVDEKSDSRSQPLSSTPFPRTFVLLGLELLWTASGSP